MKPCWVNFWRPSILLLWKFLIFRQNSCFYGISLFRRDSNLLQSFSILQSFSEFFKRKPSLFVWKPSLLERRLYYTFLLCMKTFFDPSLIERRQYYTFLLSMKTFFEPSLIKSSCTAESITNCKLSSVWSKMSFS